MDVTEETLNFSTSLLDVELSTTYKYENKTDSLPPECLGSPDINYNDTYVTTGYSYEAVIVISALVGVFCLYVLLGNIAVILVILRDRVISQQSQHQYLISLAVADALLAVLVVPFTLANELSGKWPFGSIYCQIYLAADVLFCTASIWSICAIGLDRYWSVKQPVNNQRKRTKKVIRLIIVTVWMLSFAISVLPFIFGFQTIPISSEKSCFINNSSWYILFSCTLSFFLPVIIIAPVYTKIYLIGRKHSRPMTSSKNYGTSKKEAARPVKPNNNIEDAESVKSFDPDKSNGGMSPSKQFSTNGQPSAAKSDDPTNMGYSCLYATTQTRLSLPTQVRKHGSVTKVELEPDTEDTPLHVAADDDLKSKQDARSRKRIFSGPSAPSGLSMTSIVVFFKRKNRRESEPISKKAAYYHKRERRFTVIICIVTGGFLLCWYPFFQTYVAYALCGKTCCINKTFFKTIFWLGYLNSGLNPAIYTIFNKEFRRAFRRLIFKRRNGTS